MPEAKSDTTQTESRDDRARANTGKPPATGSGAVDNKGDTNTGQHNPHCPGCQGNVSRWTKADVIASALLSLGILLATGWAAYSTWGQWDAMKSTLEATNKLAAQAQNQVEAARSANAQNASQFVESQRAKLIFKDLSVSPPKLIAGKAQKTGLLFTNMGHAPAYVVQACGNGEVFDADKLESLSCTAPCSERRSFAIAPGDSPPIGIKIRKLTVPEVSDIKNKQRFLVLRAEIVYMDGFSNRPRLSAACLIYDTESRGIPDFAFRTCNAACPTDELIGPLPTKGEPEQTEGGNQQSQKQYDPGSQAGQTMAVNGPPLHRPPNGEADGSKGKPSKYIVSGLVINGILAFGTLILATVGICQARAARDAANEARKQAQSLDGALTETKKAADAARDSADIAQANLRASFPRLNVYGFDLSDWNERIEGEHFDFGRLAKAAVAHFKIRNTGATPAIIRRAIGTMQLFSPDNLPTTYAGCQPLRIARTELKSGDIEPLMIQFRELLLPDSLLRDIVAETTSLVAYGLIQFSSYYDDTLTEVPFLWFYGFQRRDDGPHGAFTKGPARFVKYNPADYEIPLPPGIELIE